MMFTYSDSELQRIDETLEPTLAWARDRQDQCEQMALDASRLLSCTGDRLEQYAGQGFFKRCWFTLTGKRGAVERANARDLLEMQKHAWRYINLLQERDLLLAHSIIAVKNNLLTLAVSQNEVRDQVTKLADRVYDRFVALEHRVGNLEVASNIHSWLLTVEARDYDEKYTPHLRVLRVVSDFYALKSSDWSADELKFLQKALRDVGLDPKQMISVTDFVESLIDEIEGSGFQTFDELTEVDGATGLVTRNGFVVDAVSAPAFAALYQLKDNYTISSRVIRALGKRLEMTHAEAIKATIHDFISEHGIDMTATVPLKDLAVELLGCLSLAWRLARQGDAVDYATAFAAPQSVEGHEPPQQGAQSDEALRQKTESGEDATARRRAVIEECLEQYKHGDFYVGEAIPEAKLKNARVNFPIAGGATVIGLIDTTLFGGCSEGMAICDDGLYWHNDGHDAEKHKFVTWRDLSAIKESINGDGKKLIVGEAVFDPNGCHLPAKYVARLITDLIERLDAL